MGYERFQCDESSFEYGVIGLRISQYGKAYPNAAAVRVGSEQVKVGSIVSSQLAAELMLIYQKGSISIWDERRGERVRPDLCQSKALYMLESRTDSKTTSQIHSFSHLVPEVKGFQCW